MTAFSPLERRAIIVRIACSARTARRSQTSAALVVLMCVALAGCSGSSVSAASNSVAEQQQAIGHTGVPIAFAADKGVPLPSAASENTNAAGDQVGAPSVALIGDTVFVTTGTAVQVIDGATGLTIGTVKPDGTVPDPSGQGDGFAGGGYAPARIVSFHGQLAALVGYLVELPGQGTTPPSTAVEVDLISSTARLLWHFDAPLPVEPSDITDEPIVSFVGSSGDVVVATVGDPDDGYRTLAFDIARRTVLWQNAAFLARTVVGDTVVGTLDPSSPWVLGADNTSESLTVTGLNPQTGTSTWQMADTAYAANIQQAGPDTVLVEADVNENDVISLVRSDTGKSTVVTSQSIGPADSLPWTCQFGGVTIVVCGDSSDLASVYAFAVDGANGQVLWQLPDKQANRIAPAITTVYDGEVYGTTSNGPVVLDERTGKDVNDSPGVAPVLLDSDIGIADSQNGLETYPATRWR